MGFGKKFSVGMVTLLFFLVSVFIVSSAINNNVTKDLNLQRVGDKLNITFDNEYLTIQGFFYYENQVYTFAQASSYGVTYDTWINYNTGDEAKWGGLIDVSDCPQYIRNNGYYVGFRVYAKSEGIELSRDGEYLYLNDRVKIHWKDLENTDNQFQIYNSTVVYLTDNGEKFHGNVVYDPKVIIEISGAEHLDENRDLIQDIYSYVNESDNLTYIIPDGEFVRVIFEDNLTNENHIDIISFSNSGGIEIYEKDSDSIIGLITNVVLGWNFIYLNHTGNQTIFDLKSIGDIIYDFITDPPQPPQSITKWDTPDPVDVGNDIKYNATGDDPDDDTYELVVCSTSTIDENQPSAGGTCDATEICKSSQVADTTEAKCNYTTLIGDAGTFVVYSTLCDSTGRCGSVTSQTTTVETTYGTLNVSISSPTNNSNWRAGDTNLTINATVSCVGGDCGTVYAEARYNLSSASPDTEINNSNGALPFSPIHSDISQFFDDFDDSWFNDSYFTNVSYTDTGGSSDMTEENSYLFLEVVSDDDTCGDNEAVVYFETPYLNFDDVVNISLEILNNSYTNQDDANSYSNNYIIICNSSSTTSSTTGLCSDKVDIYRTGYDAYNDKCFENGCENNGTFFIEFDKTTGNLTTYIDDVANGTYNIISNVGNNITLRVINSLVSCNAGEDGRLNYWYLDNFLINEDTYNSSVQYILLGDGEFWNVSWNLNVTSYDVESYLIDVNFSSSYGTGSIAENNTEDRQINLKNYGWLNVSISSPTNNSNWYEGNTNLTINATVTCMEGSCGTVYAEARYNLSSASPDQEINGTIGGSPFYTTCYQESANVSTDCGGLDTGGYVGSSSSFNVYINYTKPQNSFRALWKVKTGADGGTNYTYKINDSCWDFNSNNITLRINATVSGFRGYCRNASGWKLIGSNVGSGYTTGDPSSWTNLIDGDWSTYSSFENSLSNAWEENVNSDGNVYEEGIIWEFENLVLENDLTNGESYTFNWTLNVTSSSIESYLIDVNFSSSYGNSLVAENNTEDRQVNLNPSVEGPTAYTRNINLNMSFGGLSLRISNFIRNLPGSFNLNFLVERIKGVIATISETFKIEDSVTRLYSATRIISETTDVNILVSRLTSLNKIITQDINVIPNIERVLGVIRLLDEDINIDDVSDSVIGRGRNPLLNIYLYDSAEPNLGLNRIISQDILMDDLVERIKGALRNLEEIFNLSDLINRIFGADRTITNDIKVNDEVSRIYGGTRTISDIFDFSDLVKRIYGTERNVADTIILYFNVTPTHTEVGQSLVRTISEAIRIDISLERIHGFSRTIMDIFKVEVQQEKMMEFFRTILEIFKIDELISRIYGADRISSEDISFSDSVSRIFGGTRSAEDTITISDDISRTYGATRTISDVFNIEDLVYRVVGANRLIQDTIFINVNMTETYTSVGNAYVRTISDAIGIDISLDRLHGISRTIFQTLKLGIQQDRLINLFRIVIDAFRFVFKAIGSLVEPSEPSGGGVVPNGITCYKIENYDCIEEFMYEYECPENYFENIEDCKVGLEEKQLIPKDLDYYFNYLAEKLSPNNPTIAKIIILFGIFCFIFTREIKGVTKKVKRKKDKNG